MDIQELKLADLNPAPYNPRTISKDEFKALVASLKAFGQRENLVVNKDMTIVSGHQRYEAMKHLGFDSAWCDVIDVDKRTEKKLNVTLNNPANQGKFDDVKLAEILNELSADVDYKELALDKIEPLDLSDKGEAGEEQFTEELNEEHNYVVLYFDNDIDWLNLTTLYPLKPVQSLSSKEGYKKVGVGRVVNGVDFIEKISQGGAK